MPAVMWLPVAVAVAVGLLAGMLPGRVSPPSGAWLLSILSSSVAVAVVCGLTIAAVGAFEHVPEFEATFGWCDALAEPHHHVPTAVGVSCTLLLAVGGVRVALWRRRRRLITSADGLVWEPVNVVPSGEPIAFAVPGRPGHVVVSTAMLQCLDPAEREALLAHEQAHLDHHHHRYIAVAEAATRAVPLLHPLRRRIRFCTERWADEVAAQTVGDRRVVATAIARAAVARASAGSGSLEFAGHDVMARVSALLHTERDSSVRSTPTTATISIAAAATVAAALLQAQHLIAYIAHVC